MSDTDLRQDLAASFRRLDKYGMSDLTNGSVVARDPDHPETFLTHPHGMFFHELRASDFVRVNIDGTPVDPDVAVNMAVCRPASAIFAARADVNSIIHAHGHGVMGVAALECGLLPISEAAFPFYNDIGYIDGDFYFDDDYVAAIPKALGSHKALIYRHHAFAAVGATVAEAFFWAFQLNVACEIQLRVLATHKKVLIPDPEQAQRHHDAFFAEGWVANGSVEWPGLRRLLDTEGADYKQ